MIRYVNGFLLNRLSGDVLFIHKNRPEFQKGKWNGVGGKIEPGELPLQAMVREFREETGLNTDPERWEHTILLKGPDFEVYFFRYTIDGEKFPDYQQVTDEALDVWNIEDIFADRFHVGPLPVLANMRWILPIQFTSSPLGFPLFVPYRNAERANVDDGERK